MATDTDPTTSLDTWPTLDDGRWPILRTCDADMQGHGGFQWPTSGHVEAPDWDPDPDRECGGGLHGLLWGCGNASLLAAAHGTRWLIVAVDPADVANPAQPGKVRYRRGEVLLVTTDRAEAIAWLYDHGGRRLPVSWGTSTSGDWGTSTSGSWGTSTSGDRGTSTSGDWGTSTSGSGGTSTSGNGGTSTSGDGGIVVCRWWDATAKRYRLTVGYPGEDGIEAGVAYRANEVGELVRADGVQS